MIDALITRILSIPRVAKRLIVIVVDILLCSTTVWLSFCLRLDAWVILSGSQLITIPVSIAVAIPIFIRVGLYRAVFRYVGWQAFSAILKAVGLYGLVYAAIFTWISFPGVPRTVGLLQPLLLLIAVGLSRLVARFFLGEPYRRILSGRDQSNVLIYGAGSIGRQVTSALANSGTQRVIGFLDDDRTLHNSVINGVRVYDPAALSTLVVTHDVRTVLLALPALKPSRRREIIDSLRGKHVAVRTAPNVSEIAQGRLNISAIQELDLNDLLGREPVEPDQNLLHLNVEGKTVLVTGAGGSIGSELCRQIVALKPRVLLLVEQSEYSLYAIHRELSRLLPANAERIIPLLASVRDEHRLNEILTSWSVDTIYHAAAYKHVPLVEQNPVEGIRTNVLGTQSLASAAISHGVSSFVLVSTDKAVRPTNIMGASKRLAEMVIQAIGEACEGTVFSAVRFGNVLGSSGSVVPLFRQQIREGGPLTLTHPEITRFFMTIPEASQLVIQAGAMAKGGDVFVLDMGEPVKIMDLARRMVELSGHTVKDESNPTGDIEFVMTGLRPAEKLYEELLIGNKPSRSQHPLIFRAKEDFVPWPTLQKEIAHLVAYIDGGKINEMKKLLTTLITGYQPSPEIVDLIALQKAGREVS
nr:nucleoside-diphosphate sugar epimerase/dehydratase [Pseudorhizobium endolithicum]